MFDPSAVQIFRARNSDGTEDTTAIYAMIDESLVAEAKQGLTPTQQAVIDNYRYVPTAQDYASRGFPVWAGNSPPSVYFKISGTVSDQNNILRSALAKRWRDPPL